MTLPALGALPMSGFANAWFVLCPLLVVGLVTLYIVMQHARHKRELRFANMELLEAVAPKRNPGRWRHVPVALLIGALAVLTTAMAGPTHDIRGPQNRATVMLAIDSSESMVSTDVAPTRLDAAKAAGKHLADELTPGSRLPS
ncbi:MAG: BatA domain-containing protein [Mycobacteriaceae bacterium]|nr:BatA domain-containing protein [Mycobacteriaceae bacterium]MBV9639247.1 BatA domain-containing protein [Mycobacteriaceae bacterium]